MSTKLENSIGSFFGDIRSIKKLTIPYEAGKVFANYALTNHSVSESLYSDTLSGSAVKYDNLSSKNSTIAETLERICLVTDPINTVPYAFVKGKYLEEYFRYLQWSQDVEVPPEYDGLMGWNIIHSRKSWLPKYITHMVPPNDLKNTISSSNGVAAGQNIQQATENAILELIERDAFMTSWYTGLGVYKIGKKLNNFIDNKSENIDFYFIENSLKIPTVMCVINSDVFPRISVGCATRKNFSAAVNKSFTEAKQSYVFLKQSSTNLSIDDKYTNSQESRLIRYGLLQEVSYPEILSNAELYKSDKHENINSLIDRIKEFQLNITLFNMTPDYYKNYGISVVRAWSPELYPLSDGSIGNFISNHPKISENYIKPSYINEIGHFFP